jgi:hypothetical protein
MLLLVLIDYLAYPRLAQFGGRSHNRATNGLWLRYTWYFGEHSPESVDRLITQLQNRAIRYAFFHVRDVGSDGSLRFRHGEAARRLTRPFRRADSVEPIAWVSINNASINGDVRLSDPDVCRTIASEARWLVDDCGFTGVQLDYEICPDEDEGFLTLLRATRAALPDDALLSVAAPILVPGVQGRFGWTEGYFARVAQNCDQIAVMAYDTAFVLPRAYVWLVRQQTLRITQAVAAGDPTCRVLIGLPTYGDANSLPSHHAHAENLRLGLKAVREGLSDPRAVQAAFEGIAIFPEWETDADEWAEYRRYWVGGSPPNRTSPP